jgi:hypothetical protein
MSPSRRTNDDDTAVPPVTGAAVSIVNGVLNDYRRNVGASAVLAGSIMAVVNYVQGDHVLATALLLAVAGLTAWLSLANVRPRVVTLCQPPDWFGSGPISA